MKPEPRPSTGVGNTAAAQVRLIEWCLMLAFSGVFDKADWHHLSSGRRVSEHSIRAWRGLLIALMAVDDIHCIVHIARHSHGRPGIARSRDRPLRHKADEIAQIQHVFPARDGRLRA
jgi:hypothetical protein